MQLEGLMMLLFIIIIVPITIMSANHNVFFVLMGFILVVYSIRNVSYSIFFMKRASSEECDIEVEDISVDDDNDIIQDIEDATNINMQKFSMGVAIVRNLTIILFFIYCALYFRTFPFVVLIAGVLLYWVKETICLFYNIDFLSQIKEENIFSSFLSIFASLAAIFIIITVAYNKFVKNII